MRKKNIILIIIIVFLAGAEIFLISHESWVKKSITKNLSKSSVDYSCRDGSDCALVIQNSWFDCKLQNTCEPVDYSLSKWVAVNQQWYSQTNLESCPATRYPPLDCDPKPINDQYTSKCIRNHCQKTALE